MNILLVAINAKYIHSNLAVYSLKSYAKEYQEHIKIAEYTINHPVSYILQEIYKQGPDVLCFSCYIWNFRYVQELIAELHKLRPSLPIWAGGPEVSYGPELFLGHNPGAAGVMLGEGEGTFRELCRFYLAKDGAVQGREDMPAPDGIGQGREGMFAPDGIGQDKEGMFAPDGIGQGKEDMPAPDGIGQGKGKGCRKDGMALELRRHREHVEEGAKELEDIAGILFRDGAGKLIKTPQRAPLPMDSLPFCYSSLEGFEHRILYYETSRGCPFSCTYCLSSLEKSLRFRPFSLVKPELDFFLGHQVPQVKFVDRTFNCSHSHAMEIWRYIKEHDNGITNFHFEVSADLLSEEELALIASMRPGLVQLEIGVQSTHGPTIQEIHRSMDLGRLERAVARLQQAGNVHQHLDLIAGLPKEDFPTFAESFRQVYQWKPQQLQLGFLKVLKGSWMYQHREEYGLVYQEQPPYEVLATKWLSFGELLDIKLAEEMLEVYYNSGQFGMTMKVLELTMDNPFYLFLELGKFYEKRGLLAISHSRLQRCRILLEFTELTDPSHLELYKETLTFDLYFRENMKTRPSWAPDRAEFKEITRKYCKKGKLSHAEPFWHDMETVLQQKTLGEYPKKLPERQFYLFSYGKKDPLTGQAEVRKIGNDQEDETDFGTAG